MLYRPFNDIIHDTAPPPLHPLPISAPPPPVTIDQLRKGDLCLLHLPGEEEEKLTLCVYLGVDEGDGPNEIIVQWYDTSSVRFADLPDKLRRAVWMPGWYQPKTRQYYFLSHPQHRSHPEYTNLLSDHSLTARNILLHGLSLERNRLSAATVETALQLLASTSSSGDG